VSSHPEIRTHYHSTPPRLLLECHHHPLWSTPIPGDPFAPLRQRFLARCADQLAELKAARKGGLFPGSDAPLIHIAHSLAGPNGDMLGIDDLTKFVTMQSDYPQAVLDWVRSLNANGPLPDDFSLLRIQF
jgi:hypothetical protein